jgi:hypothetical protein
VLSYSLVNHAPPDARINNLDAPAHTFFLNRVLPSSDRYGLPGARVHKKCCTFWLIPSGYGIRFGSLGWTPSRLVDMPAKETCDDGDLWMLTQQEIRHVATRSSSPSAAVFEDRRSGRRFAGLAPGDTVAIFQIEIALCPGSEWDARGRASLPTKLGDGWTQLASSHPQRSPSARSRGLT